MNTIYRHGTEFVKTTTKKGIKVARVMQKHYAHQNKFVYAINMQFPFITCGINNKIPTSLRKLYEYASKRSERVSTIFAFSHFETVIYFNILSKLTYNFVSES